MKFAHIADTHIRNLKYHTEYRVVFDQLYEELRKENVDYIINALESRKKSLKSSQDELIFPKNVNLIKVIGTFISFSLIMIPVLVSISFLFYYLEYGTLVGSSEVFSTFYIDIIYVSFVSLAYNIGNNTAQLFPKLFGLTDYIKNNEYLKEIAEINESIAKISKNIKPNI